MATATATKRILVVDDERSVCASVEKILARRGHAVEKALSVPSAVTCLEQGPGFDLIIADLMMPQSSGLDLLRVVRDRWPHTPLMIMTGYASIASAIEATRAGAVGYLPKPFTPDELDAALAHVALVMRPPVPGPAVRAAQRPAPSPGPPATGEVIDVDMPFDAGEVAAATSPQFVKQLTRSDLTVIDFCALGQRACKRFKTKGVCTQVECPLVTAERRKKAAAASTGHLEDQIDVDMPFSWSEVAAVTSPAYADALGRGDMPVAGRWDAKKAAGRKVLVVDDEPVVANSMRRALSRRGFHVEEAFTGREALTRILDEMFDLVLLDMKMPDANGLELLPAIHRHRPRLPVVLVTGYASIDTAVEAIQRGASDYMAKPFTPDELYATARRAIHRA